MALTGKTESKCALRPGISPNADQRWLLPVCCLWLCRDLSIVASAAQEMRNECAGMSLGEGMCTFTILTSTRCEKLLLPNS
jgi:hypothetical protein